MGTLTRIVASIALLISLLGANPAYAAECLTPAGTTLVLASDSGIWDVTGLTNTDVSGCTYRDLHIMVEARHGTQGTVQSRLHLQFGGSTTPDTGTNYNYDHLELDGASANELKNFNYTYIEVGKVPVTVPSQSASGFDIFIPNAWNTSFDKEIIYRANFGENYNPCTGCGNDTVMILGGGVWHPSTPTAIGMIRFELDYENMLAGSTITIYRY